MQVVAAMWINHTVMKPGWVTAHQRTHESPFAFKFQDPLVPKNKQCMTAALQMSDVTI